MNNNEQLFLNELDNKFWKAADKLRANMGAANYKHVLLGKITLQDRCVPGSGWHPF